MSAATQGRTCPGCPSIATTIIIKFNGTSTRTERAEHYPLYYTYYIFGYWRGSYSCRHSYGYWRIRLSYRGLSCKHSME